MKLRLLTVLAVLVAACGASEEGTSSDRDQAPVASSSTTTTTAPSTTTTTPSTTTSADPTTTTQPAEDNGLLVLAADKVAGIEAVVPTDYSFETVLDDDGVNNELFEACLDDEDFSLADIDDVTAVAYDIAIEAPSGGVFSNAEGTVEVRVFEGADVAAEAFGTLEKVLGTDEGRACVAQQFADALAADLGEGSEVTVDFAASALPGHVGTSLVVNIASEALEGVVFFELVATIDGPCAVYSVFSGFDEPFDGDVASTLVMAGA